MKTANIRTIRHDFSSVLKAIQNGETVAITNRNKTVALLTPPAPPARRSRKDAWAGLRRRIARLKGQPLAPQTAAELLSEDRERY